MTKHYFLILLLPFIAMGSHKIPGGDMSLRPGKDYALFFAVKNYPNSGWDDLRNPIRDADSVAIELHDIYGFDTVIYRNPVKDTIRAVLSRWQLKSFGPSDQLFVFFTGHGDYLDVYGTGYFIPSDSEADDLDTYFSLDEIKRAIDRIDCNHILLGIDACYSGTVNMITPFKSKEENLIPSDIIELYIRNKSRLLLTSGGKQRTPDGDVHSPFVEGFLKALRSNYKKEDGILLFTELLGKLRGVSPTPYYAGLNRDMDGGFIFLVSDKVLDSLVFINNNNFPPYNKRQNFAIAYSLHERPTANNSIPITDLPHSPNMVRIRGGKFQMGNSSDRTASPVHEVSIPDFYLAETEVTVAQYMVFVTETNSNYPEWYIPGTDKGIRMNADPGYKYLGAALTDDNHPITGISWDDAVAYCEWLSKKTKRNYRLPSEAEWEYAAGNAANSDWSGTSNPNAVVEYGWYRNNSGGKTQVVRMKKPNALGLFDMSGNVSEWCADYWHNDYRGAPANGKARQGNSPDRVIRGGYFNDPNTSLTVTYRSGKSHDLRIQFIGFRPASDH